MKKLLLLTFVLIGFANWASDISPLCGTWKANRNASEDHTDVLFIYEVCGATVRGFTYDQDKNGGFCLYRFQGTYDESKKKLRAECTEEIKIKNHVPTFYLLNFQKGIIKKRLKGKKTTQKTYLAWASDNINYRKKDIDDFSKFTGGVYLKKALEEKYQCGCIDVEEEEEEVEEVQEEIVEDKRVDDRQNKNLKTFETKIKSVKIKLKDGNKIDGDKVSIFLNGRLIYGGVRVGRFKKKLKFDLPSGKSHEITFVADNLGSVPPNTADIEVIIGKARYELSLNCDMNTNNVIRINN